MASCAHWLRRSAVAAVLALLAGCTQAVDGRPGGAGPVGGTPPPSATPAEPAFHDCSAVLHLRGLDVEKALQGHLTATCGQVPVPLDYADPSASQLAITVISIHDDAAGPHAPSLFVNPGGPGASGIDLALGLLGHLPPRVLEHYDLVGFDPRGVGLSSPVRCTTDRQKDRDLAESPDVTTATGFAAAKRAARTFAEACERRYGSSLQYYDTVATAEDLDRLRGALDDRRLDYLGFSYGTELGSVYAHLFPQRVGAMVLDGAVDPLTSGVDQLADQVRGFEDAFDQFASWCRGRPPCASLGNPRAAAERVVARAGAAPLATGTSRPLTAALAITGVLEALYSRSDWPALARALGSARGGDGGPLLRLADRYNHRRPDGHYDNLIDANTVISCNDARPGPSDAVIHRVAASWTARFPLFGGSAAAALFACQQWQPHRTPPPRPTAATSTEVLVVGNLHDPATPYQGAKDLARVMGNAELLGWNGEGHTSYLEGSRCVDRYVTRYLVTQRLPPAATTCPA